MLFFCKFKYSKWNAGTDSDMNFKDFFDIFIYFLLEALFPPESSVRIMNLVMNQWYNGRSLDLELDRFRLKLQSFID